MRKTISLLLVIVLSLSCISFTACGGGGEKETASAPSNEQTDSSTSGGDLSWNDILIYSGAKQVQKGSWSIPPAEGDWSKVEWRYYSMEDDLNNVAMVSLFYKMEMPKSGWQKIRQTEVQGTFWGYYSKNNEQDGAIVWVGSDEGETVFAIMRAAK